MKDFQIVGIMLVRNEDVFIERAIRNVIEFCDRLIITDHQSTDRTFEICERLAKEFPKIELKSIWSPHESSLAIEPYAGTGAWIFGVDGDEIYDPQGLMVMRKSLLDGVFSSEWCVFGNVLNVVSLDMTNRTAKGYLAPPSRPVTKLYNFSIIEGWLNCPERLHGEDILFKPGFDASLRRQLHKEVSWEESHFRCLHTPFMQRSSQQKNSLVNTRLNPDELMRIGVGKNGVSRLVNSMQIGFSRVLGSDWKHKKYRRGPLVEKDVSAFFSQEM